MPTKRKKVKDSAKVNPAKQDAASVRPDAPEPSAPLRAEAPAGQAE